MAKNNRREEEEEEKNNSDRSTLPSFHDEPPYRVFDSTRLFLFFSFLSFPPPAPRVRPTVISDATISIREANDGEIGNATTGIG